MGPDSLARAELRDPRLEGVRCSLYRPIWMAHDGMLLAEAVA